MHESCFVLIALQLQNAFFDIKFVITLVTLIVKILDGHVFGVSTTACFVSNNIFVDNN